MSDEDHIYELSTEALTGLEKGDLNSVANDLGDMAVGQECLISNHFPGSVGEKPPKIRAEYNLSELKRVLGERKDSYEMRVEEFEKIEGCWRFSVRRVR